MEIPQCADNGNGLCLRQIQLTANSENRFLDLLQHRARAKQAAFGDKFRRAEPAELFGKSLCRRPKVSLGRCTCDLRSRFVYTRNFIRQIAELGSQFIDRRCGRFRC